jgi:FkbM family methyltransferase
MGKFRAGVRMITNAIGVITSTDRSDRLIQFAGLEHNWRKIWPLSRGRWVWSRFRGLAGATMPTEPIRAQVEENLNLLLDPKDLIGNEILTEGNWEPETWEWMASRLPPGGVFADVGTHIGYHSIKAAKRVGPMGRVLSFEPNPGTAAQLKENIRYSGLSNIKLHEFACADHEGEAEFFAAGRGNTGRSSLSAENALGDGEIRPYRVRLRPLDAVITESAIQRLDLMKVDVEGAELMVLRGAEQTLRRFRPVLLVELIDKNLESMKTSRVEVIEFLSALGYRVSRAIFDNVEFVC